MRNMLTRIALYLRQFGCSHQQMESDGDSYCEDGEGEMHTIERCSKCGKTLDTRITTMEDWGLVAE